MNESRFPLIICCECTATDPNHQLCFVEPTVIDFGIGSYECHGYCGVDVQLEVVCPDCETDHFLDPNTLDLIELNPYD